MKKTIFFILMLISASFCLEDSLRAEMVSIAKGYTVISSEPIYVTEEGVVGFEGNISNIEVTVNPETLEIFGFVNYDLVGDGVERYSKDDAFGKALQVYNSLPSRFRSEYMFYNFLKTYSYNYVFTWKRYVNGTMLYDNELFARVDYSNLNLIEWYVIYDEEVNVEPTVTEIQAIVAAQGMGEVGETISAVYNGSTGWIAEVSQGDDVSRYFIDSNGITKIDEQEVDSPKNIIESNIQIDASNFPILPVVAITLLLIIVLWLSYRREKSRRLKLRKIKSDAKRQVRKELSGT